MDNVKIEVIVKADATPLDQTKRYLVLMQDGQSDEVYEAMAHRLRQLGVRAVVLSVPDVNKVRFVEAEPAEAPLG